MNISLFFCSNCKHLLAFGISVDVGYTLVGKIIHLPMHIYMHVQKARNTKNWEIFAIKIDSQACATTNINHEIFSTMIIKNTYVNYMYIYNYGCHSIMHASNFDRSRASEGISECFSDVDKTVLQTLRQFA